MPNVNAINSSNALITELLKNVAKDRAASLRYNTRALIIIYSILVLVVLLGLFGADILFVASVAIGGFVIFWFFTWRRGKKLEVQLYQEERKHYKELAASNLGKGDGEEEATIPGKIPLTQRELEILTLIARGNMNKEIARLLELSPNTVRNYTVRILRRLEVDDRTSAAVLAISRGWIKNDSWEQITAPPHQPNGSPPK